MRRGALGALLAVAAGLVCVWGAERVLAQLNARGVDVVAVAGTEFTAPVAAFESTAPPGRFTAQIRWGDGSAMEAGTIATRSSCPFPDQTCYEVRGTHTYAAPGSFTVIVDIVGPEGRPTVRSTATVGAPPGPPPPPGPPGPPGGATAEILGPSRLSLSDPARFIALTSPGAVRHEWDLDGDGAYERDTGADPAVDHGFPRAGGHRVGLRATFPGGGALTATRDVAVQRPPVIGLDIVGTVPKPGKRVRLRLGIERERGTDFELFAWRIGGVKPRRRSIVLPGGRGEPDQVVKLRNGQPTVKPTLVTSFPKKGSYPLVVEALDSAGHTATLHANVHVGAKLPSNPLREAPIDCDEEGVPGGYCPQAHLLSQPATKVKTAFAFTAPSAKACLPKNATLQQALKLGKLGDALDLPYPSPTEFAGAAKVEKDCLEAEPEALRWTFGDGAVLQGPPGGSLPKVVSHVYGAPGKYTATVQARVPYFVQNLKPGKKKGLKAADMWDLHFKVATKSIEVDVVEGHCGNLSLNGIQLRSVPGTAGQFDIPDIGAQGCFLPDKTLGGGKTLYKTFAGYDLDLNTVSVRSGSPSAADPDDVEIVDPAADQIRAMPGESLQARFSVKVGQASGTWNVGGGPVIDVPKPKPDAELGGPVAPLKPGFAIGPQFTGLSVKAVHVFLAPDRGALARFWLRTPKPLQGDAPVVVGGGPGLLASSASAEEEADLTMDLSGLDLGLFEVQDFTLGHRPSGGWFGGGSLRVPALDFSFLAPYKPPPAGDTTSAACASIDGPSGIELDGGGSFEHGGFVAKVPIPIPPVIELNCIAVSGQSEPFVMVGKVAGTVPPKGPFTVDGCFLMGILANGQQASGCGGTAAAKEDLTWFRAAGGVKVYFLGLANGYVDIRRDADLLQASAKGTISHSVGIDVGPVNGSLGVKGTVEGALVFQPQFGFHLLGGVGLCVENPGPDVGCVDIAQAGVSSKGFGACSWLASFVYLWKSGPDAWLGNCDLDDEIGVTSAFLGAPALDGPLTRSAAANVRSVRVPSGLRQVGFRIRGDGGAPVVSLEGPGGRRVADDGRTAQRGRRYDVIHGVGETLVVVRRPPGGVWRIAARDGSPAIAGVGVSLPLREPRVSGRVLRRGARRVLAYRARLAPTDRLVLLEEGRTVTRQLGRTRRGGRGRIRLRAGDGSPGRRTIVAVVERRGVAHRRLRVARYRAPRADRPRRPRGLRLRLARARGRVAWRRELLVRWRPARGARSYEVAARLSDGRRLRLHVRRHSLRLPNFDPALGARVRVVSVGAGGRRSPAAAARWRARPPTRIVSRL